MTTVVHTTGPVTAKIQFDPGNASPPAFVDLGYSQDGFSLSERPLMNDVHSDSNGGLTGNPIDVQYMGTVYTIRAKLLEFEWTTVKRLRQIATKTALADGEVAATGCLLLAEEQQFRLLLEGAKDTAALDNAVNQTALATPLNFLNCIVRDVIDVTVGSKVTEIDLVLTAYPFIDAGDSNLRKIYNRDVAA
jgi:hypothetical protein